MSPMSRFSIVSPSVHTPKFGKVVVDQASLTNVPDRDKRLITPIIDSFLALNQPAANEASPDPNADPMLRKGQLFVQALERKGYNLTMVFGPPDTAGVFSLQLVAAPQADGKTIALSALPFGPDTRRKLIFDNPFSDAYEEVGGRPETMRAIAIAQSALAAFPYFTEQ